MASNYYQSIKEEVIKDINNGIPYSEIQTKYGIRSKSTINRMKNSVDNLGDVKDKPSSREIGRRRKIQRAALNRSIVKNSEIMAGGIINILKGIEYSVKNLEQIQESNKKENDEIADNLKQILEMFETHIHDIRLNKNGDDIGKMETIKEIKLASIKVGDVISRDMVRIRAIAELRSQIASYVELKVVAEELGYVKQFIQTLFKHLQVMSDEQYIEYRNKVISEFELAKMYFDDYEKSPD